VADALYATLKTNQGDIVVKLFPDHAPKTVKNFTELALGAREWTDPKTGQKSTARLYDGTVFHRGHRRLHDPGRRPARQWHGRPGLQVR
jgi:peptidyl-prolyl cis-trans isomerase A (cyclophilin A)